MSGLLPGLIFPSDIEAVQKRLKASADGTDVSVKACSLDVGTSTSWGKFYDAVTDYCTTGIYWLPQPWSHTSGATASFYERGLDYEKELYEWQVLIQGKGCQLSVPPHEITKPDTDNFVAAMKWGAVIVGSLASVYVVSKFAPVIVDGAKQLLGESKKILSYKSKKA